MHHANAPLTPEGRYRLIERCRHRPIAHIAAEAGISRLRNLDPDDSTNRVVGTITARFPGHMVHLDVKKVGRIPNGGGHRVHGRGSDQHRASDRAKGGYVFLRPIVDGYSRLAY